MNSEFNTVTKKSRLRRVGTAMLPERTRRFDPKMAMKTGDDRFIWNEFNDRILSVTKRVNSTPVSSLVYFDLTEAMSDDEIGNDLPEGHIFEDASIFCAHLDAMLDRQKSGGNGDLLTNGYVNIFYVRGKDGGVFAVDVYWNADIREWYVFAYWLVGYRWFRGYRVFSASNC